MPEFVLDIGSPEGATRFADLDDFTRGYVTCVFWLGVEDPEDDSGNTDADVTFDDLAPETLQSMIADCHRFQQDAAEALSEAYGRGYSEERAGHDFWLTRNGHGAGFWDRDVLQAAKIGERLTSLCGWRTTFGGVDLYLGDDGKIYS